MIIQKNIRHFVLLLCLLSFVACKSAEKKAGTSGQETTAYKQLALKWGDQVKYDFNTDRSMVLAQSLPAPNDKSLRISYFVFDMKTEKVRTEGNLETGAVQWLSVKEIEVFNTPGKMAPNQTRDDYTMVINVITGEQTPKSQWKR